jgi:clan AA aspartic protease
MDKVYAEIELINGGDLALVRRHVICDKEVRKINVSAQVDKRVLMLCINEHIQKLLQLPVVEKGTAILADGNMVEVDIVAPVEIRFKNRQTTCRAMVLPNVTEPVLGAIPLADMDVVIHRQNQELIVNPSHPDMALVKVK